MFKDARHRWSDAGGSNIFFHSWICSDQAWCSGCSKPMHNYNLQKSQGNSNCWWDYTKIFPFPTFISPDALRVIERITEILKRIPEFALIITSESAEVFSSSLSSQHIPWFITKAGSYVVTAGMCHMLPHVITVSVSHDASNDKFVRKVDTWWGWLWGHP